MVKREYKQTQYNIQNNVNVSKSISSGSDITNIYLNQCKQINKYDVSDHVQYRMRKLKRDGIMRSNKSPSGSVELAQKTMW